MGAVDDGTLEPLAEDGDPSALAALLESETGLASPLAPGVGATHAARIVSFRSGATAVEGLEWVAEDGDPTLLLSTVEGYRGVRDATVFNTPDGASDPGPALPGDTYSFVVTGNPGDRLVFATMIVQSNDAFVGPGTGGIDLFPGGAPLTGDITNSLVVWDAGTEVDEFPGAGPNQAPRQAGPNTGADQNGTLQPATGSLSNPADFVRVTVTPL